MKRKFSNAIKNAIIVIIGNAIYAFGISFFVEPSGLIMGGTTGIALVVHANTGIPVSLMVAILNSGLFIIGLIILGKKFAFNTLISTVSYPVFLQLTNLLASRFFLTDDPLICAVFGGLCIGISLSMILRIGASTGGMDIPTLILNKFFRIPISFSLYAFDFLILIGQMFFSDKPSILYGILLVIIYSISLDKFIAMGDNKVMMQIVSKKTLEIKARILDDVDRGATMLHGVTGHLENETEILQTVIAPREMHKIEKIIQEIDPHAFVTVSKVSSVSGRGFTAEKKYI